MPTRNIAWNRQMPVRGKHELILQLCRNKTVLDLGCVLHSWRMSIDQPDWLHRQINDVAASCPQLIGKPLHLLTRAPVRLRPYLNSDFAAILALRPGGKPQADPQASSGDVIAYLCGGTGEA
jgi:hypothetical protein